MPDIRCLSRDVRYDIVAKTAVDADLDQDPMTIECTSDRRDETAFVNV